MAYRYDYEHIKERKIYDILRPIGHLWLKCAFKYEYAGVENIPEGGGFIIAGNHMHLLDPMAIALAMDDRQMHFMAKKELFDHLFTRFIFTCVNGFPVARGRADTAAMDYACRIPGEGKILGIFPEGTRSKDGKIARPKRGIATIVAKAKCDIVPVSIYNNEGFKKHTRVTVRFGKPIKYEELSLGDEPSREELKAAADYIMDKIKVLWEEGHCE